jgi:hypothetical protein
MRKLAPSLTIASVILAASHAALAQPAPAPAPAAPDAPPQGQVTPPGAPAPAPLLPAPVPAPPLQMAPAPMPIAPAPAPTASVQMLSLDIMRDKGLITAAEYESAVHALNESIGAELAMKKQNLVFGKWSTTLYGFVEADSIYDSTRSLNDSAGNSLIARAGSLNGDNSRWTFGARNSRLGFRIAAPETHGVRASAQVESDFLGTQLPVGNGPYCTGTSCVNPAFGTEGAFLTNPTFRIRHMNLKLETPVVDIMFGQYWQLFGWGSGYQPNTVEIQGIPGEVYARTPQFRISKTLKADPISVDIAVAAVRPVQRDGGLPDGEAGLRFAVDSWTGVQTTGSTGTQTAPLSVGVSGLLRHVAVNDFPAQGTNTHDLTLSAIAVDGYLPLIPGTVESKDNSFSLNGEFATGYGDADMYTGLTGGLAFPSTTAGYSPDIDNGIVTFDSKGGLHGIQWTSYIFGAQYYLPGVDGKLWVSGNYSHMESANSHFYANGSTAGTTKSVMAAEDWFDVNLFVDPVPAVRFGLEYANTNTMYVDGIHAINHRVQFSGFFIF